MTRDTVIQMLRETGDALLAECQRMEVTPDRLFLVLRGTMERGLERMNSAGGKVASGGDAEYDEFVPELAAALVQVAAAASLLLELMPETDAPIVTLGTKGDAN